MRAVVFLAPLLLAVAVGLAVSERSRPGPSAEPAATQASTREPVAPLAAPPVLRPEGEAAEWPPEVWDPPAPGEELPPLPTADAVMALLMSQMEQEFQHGLIDANEEWIPSRASLGYWLHWQLDQITELSPERVAAYLGVDDPYYPLVVDQRSANLTELFSWPTEEDIDRLWNGEETRRMFEAALHAKHYADIAEEARATRWHQLQHRSRTREEYERMYAADPLIPRLADLRAHLEATEAEWWEELWAADPQYPHWSFLMRVAQRHFQ
jgi:hypothetical protein